MLIPKQALSVVACVATESTRYAINGILIERDEDGVVRTVATDGRRLAVVTWPEPDPADYPPLDSVDPVLKVPGFGAILSTKDVKTLIKDVPKNRLKPLLENIALEEVPYEVGETKPLKLGATDLDTASSWSITPLEGNFPRWRDVIPPTSDKEVSIRVNAKFLMEACKMALQFPGESGDAIVELVIQPAESGPSMKPLKISAQGEAGTMTHIIMPVNDGMKLRNHDAHYRAGEGIKP